MLPAVARVVRGLAWAIAAVVVLGILIYVTEANTGNWLVGAVMDVARWFADPFRFIFQLDENKAQVTLNWGIGALAYAAIGQTIGFALDAAADRIARREPPAEDSDVTRTKAA